MIGRRFPSHPSDVLRLLEEGGQAMTDVSELLAKIETIVAQWRRKIWTDAQALGNIENAILKHHVANRVEHRKPGKP